MTRPPRLPIGRHVLVVATGTGRRDDTQVSVSASRAEPDTILWLDRPRPAAVNAPATFDELFAVARAAGLSLEVLTELANRWEGRARQIDTESGRRDPNSRGAADGLRACADELAVLVGTARDAAARAARPLMDVDV